MSKSRNTAKKHKEELQRLQGKDLEFYKYLQEHDEKLLQFEDEDIDEDINIENEYPVSGEDELGYEIRKKPIKKKKEEPAQNVITANSGGTKKFHSGGRD